MDFKPRAYHFVYFAILLDIVSKVGCQWLPKDEIHWGFLYPCWNIKPITIWDGLAAIITVSFLWWAKCNILSLLVGWGAFSNTFEQILHGKVTDMFFVPLELLFPALKTPIFNIADIMMLSGIFLTYKIIVDE